MRSLLILFCAACLVFALSVESIAAQKTLPITQVWQHKDTGMNCIPGGSAVAHAWNHALVCIHCGTYCAPAACAMYAIFTGRGGVFINQDNIYDNAKLIGGEILGNNVLETHGLGMYAGLGITPAEIQAAFTYAVGMLPFQFGPQGTLNPLLTCTDVTWCIDSNVPILWVDVGNWPQDQETLPDEIIYDSGHCKIIAGYDNKDTADCSDDSYLIYDPWPTSGSPYWLAQNQVVDPFDVYLSTLSVYGVEPSNWGLIKSLSR